MRAAFQLVLVLLLVFIAFYSQAENSCTPWIEKDPSSYCLLTGGEGRYYVRECVNEDRICKWRRTSDCEKVQLCSEIDPNNIEVCGPWRRVNGVPCPDPRARRYDRTCVVGGPVESVCSIGRPQ